VWLTAGASEAQRGKAATETRNISRKGAKHVLSNVEGAAKRRAKARHPEGIRGN